MAQVYVPKGIKRKSKAHLSEIAEKYLTNGRYDQRKSDMIAITHKEQMSKTQIFQALERKNLRKRAIVFMNFEALIDKTLVWVEDKLNQMVSPSPMQHVAAKQPKIDNLRTPGALVNSAMIASPKRNPTQKHAPHWKHKKKSSFATGKARL